jgi:hypothetical protein
MSHRVEYVEVGPRLYEVVTVPGPIIIEGQVWDCEVDDANQRIEISSDVLRDDWDALIGQVVAEETGKAVTSPWRLVPVVGMVR